MDDKQTTKEPAWIASYRVEYERDPVNPEKVFLQGCFGRFLQFADTIHLNELLEEGSNPSVLVVGAGASNYLDVTAFDLYEAVAYLEGHNIGYGTLDVVDITAEAIESVRMSTRFFFSSHKLQNWPSLAKSFDVNWETYLRYTNQFEPNSRHSGEIYAAGIPNSLEQKINRKKVGLATGDISTTALPLSGKKYDLVVCRSVLYHLSEAGQKLALYNMSNAMTKDAVLLVAQHFGITQEACKRDIEMWFDEEWQERLRLRFVETEHINPEGREVLCKR